MISVASRTGQSGRLSRSADGVSVWGAVTAGRRAGVGNRAVASVAAAALADWHGGEVADLVAGLQLLN